MDAVGDGTPRSGRCGYPLTRIVGGLAGLYVALTMPTDQDVAIWCVDTCAVAGRLGVLADRAPDVVIGVVHFSASTRILSSSMSQHAS